VVGQTDPMPHRSPELSGSAQALLDAVVAMSSDLDLTSVLSRIIESACHLTGAQYGAVGVVGPDDTLTDFITHGLSTEARRSIGAPPQGRGILGHLIDHPESLRLPDLTRHPDSAGFPPHHPPMTSFLGVPVRIRGQVFGNLYLTEKADGEFTDDDAALVGALASAAGFVIENARAYTLSERRRQWLQATGELAEALQPPLDEDAALHRIARAAGAVARARATAVVRREADARSTADTAVLSAPSAEEDRWRERVAQALAATQDWPEDVVEWVEDVDGEQLRALMVPLRAHLASSVALVSFFGPGHSALEVEERELLVSFADQAALALDRAQALADRAELAVISDRERIARDLHDTVIQRLFATGLQLQGVAMVCEDAPVTERIGRAVDDLDQVVRDIRGTIFELRAVDHTSLRSQVRSLVHDYAAILGHAPVLRLVGPLDTATPPAAAEHLVPVLREALSNVSRHARAEHTWITLTAEARSLRLVVEDDGDGPPEDPTRSSGLRNAARRAESLGGTSALRPREAGGSAFTWFVTW